ncbi:unnamed protein product, partial [Ectocarpus sp. 12 AP-2014]
TSRAAAAALAAAPSTGSSSRGFKTTTAAEPATATTTDAGAGRGPATVPAAQRLRAPGGLHPRERARATPADRFRDRPLGRAAEEPGCEVGLCPRQSRGAGAREVLPQAGPNEPDPTGRRPDQACAEAEVPADAGHAAASDGAGSGCGGGCGGGCGAGRPAVARRGKSGQGRDGGGAGRRARWRGDWRSLRRVPAEQAAGGRSAATTGAARGGRAARRRRRRSGKPFLLRRLQQRADRRGADAAGCWRWERWWWRAGARAGAGARGAAAQHSPRRHQAAHRSYGAGDQVGCTGRRVAPAAAQRRHHVRALHLYDSELPQQL